MADFPTGIYPDFKQSSEPWRDPLLIDYSKAGNFRSRRLQSGKARTFVLAFTQLTTAQRTTIETHYDAHRTATFNYTWADGGTTYVVAYANEEGLDWKRAGVGLWDVTILLAKVSP